MDDISAPVVSAAVFAHSAMRGYAERGADPADIFGAFVGLVAEQNVRLAQDTLKALDDALADRDLRPTPDR